MRPNPGVVMLALGGLAWFAVAVFQGRGPEMVFCGLTLTGFGTVLAGLRGSAPRGVVAAGFAVAASSNVAIFWTYGLGTDLGSLAAALFVAGMLVVAAGVARDAATAVRIGMALAAVGALQPVLVNDIARPGVWTLGNVLLLAGTVWCAVHWPPPDSAPSLVTA